MKPAPLTVLLAVRVVKPPPRLVLVTAEFTIAVVAIWVVDVVAETVGAVGTPVRFGEAKGAYVEAALAVVR